MQIKWSSTFAVCLCERNRIIPRLCDRHWIRLNRHQLLVLGAGASVKRCHRLNDLEFYSRFVTACTQLADKYAVFIGMIINYLAHRIRFLETTRLNWGTRVIGGTGEGCRAPMYSSARGRANGRVLYYEHRILHRRTVCNPVDCYICRSQFPCNGHFTISNRQNSCLIDKTRGPDDQRSYFVFHFIPNNRVTIRQARVETV